MRIAYLAHERFSNGYYRGVGPMTALAHRGHEVRQLSKDEDHPPLREVRGIDVLHVHRYVDERAQRLVHEAKAHGAAIVWDNDDDMGSIPKGTPAYRDYGGIRWERRIANMKRIFRLADLVTTPSAVLAERFAEAGARHVEVIENYLPDEFLRWDARPHAGVVIGWIAGAEHQLDIERIPIREALRRLLDEREDVRVLMCGLELGLGERCVTLGLVPLRQLAQEAAQFDVGIAPLADIPLSRARSNIKLKEYAAAGVPWLASPIGPYEGLGERQGGRLVPHDRWYEELLRLVEKPRERRKLAKRAAKWARGEILSKNAHIWEAKLAVAVERARATSSG